MDRHVCNVRNGYSNDADNVSVWSVDIINAFNKLIQIPRKQEKAQDRIITTTNLSAGREACVRVFLRQSSSSPFPIGKMRWSGLADDLGGC